jgi:aspartyl-tRNA(Asn)/glutamyl-tRNA(Gln) amidotransferase subunit C
MEIEELQTTARLAHLNMGEAELAAAFPAGFAEDEAPADSSALVKPAAHFRPDSLVRETGVNDEALALVDNAGDRDGRFIVVPNVL